MLFYAILSLLVFTGDAKTLEDIVLFKVVDVSHLNETTGYHTKSKAYEFTEETTDLIASENASKAFVKYPFLAGQFSVKAYVLPKPGFNGGTIIFLSGGTLKKSAFSLVYRWKTKDGDQVLSLEVTYRTNTNGGAYSCEFGRNPKIPQDKWVHIDVRQHIAERLTRCKVKTPSGDTFYRYAGLYDANAPMDRFPLDGQLRLAQQFLPDNEKVYAIQERFVGSLQDVIISFGDPNCTYTINTQEIVQKTTSAPATTPTNSMVKDYTCIDMIGNKHQNGAKWKEGQGVDCQCNNGKTYCIQTRQCIFGGKQYFEGDEWNDLSNCDRCKCENGVTRCVSTIRVKKDLGCDWRCGEDKSATCPRKRYKGCFCPDNRVLQDGKCTYPFQCSCMRNGKKYAGSFFSGCQLCICDKGKESCYRVC